MCTCLLEEKFNTKGWVQEGDVPPPTRSTKLKIIYGCKTFSVNNERTFYMTLYSKYMNGGHSQGGTASFQGGGEGQTPPPAK